jgi:hypothetical protein
MVSHWLQPAEAVLGGREPPVLLTSYDWQRHGLRDFTSRTMYLDSVSYLPSDILVKVDRASMAVSLEARCPLLDHRVVEFAWRLPLAQKVRDGTGKWLLRQVLERYVPPALFDRPPPAYGSLRHRFAGRKLQGGGGWTRTSGWAWARRSAPATPAETGPRPSRGGGCRHDASRRRCSACCGARTWSWSRASSASPPPS